MKLARATEAVAIASDPAIYPSGDGVQSGSGQEHPQRPEPPHTAKQHAPGINTAEHPAIRQLQPHLGEQLFFPHAQPLCRPGYLQRQPYKTPPRKRPAPALPRRDTEATFRIVEHPTPRVGIIYWHFGVHRNLLEIKRGLLAPDSHRLANLVPEFHELGRRGRRPRADPPIPLRGVLEELGLLARRGIIGSISRFFRSSSTPRNISQTSFMLSKWLRLPPIMCPRRTMPHPCNSLRRLLMFDRATLRVSTQSSASMVVPR